MCKNHHGAQFAHKYLQQYINNSTIHSIIIQYYNTIIQPDRIQWTIPQ